jgi:Ohr subfamily peroxiredoxin
MPQQLEKVTFSTSATARGGRTGHVTSADGVVDLDLAWPGTTAEPVANPETLFAAAYAACFQNAMINRAKRFGIDASDSTVTAEVSFGPTGDGGYGIAVALRIHIPNADAQAADELVQLAHHFCPYSRATRDNIEVSLELV